MGRLLLLGASLLAFHGHHQPRYWWPATNVCTLTTGTNRQGVWQPAPYIQCTTTAAHWGAKPAPPLIGIPVNSPQAQAFNHNYCPGKPNGWCTPPANVVNITPGYQGN